jgi:regulator of sigma E protease
MVSVNSPASVAGLQKNDRILAINGSSISKWEEISEAIVSSNGELTLQVQRKNALVFVTLSPRMSESTNMFKEKIHKRMVGIAPSGDTHILHLNPLEAIGYASKETLNASLMIFQSVQKLITGVVPTKELGGVVSIVQITADATQYGWMSLFFFAALISVNLGVLNLLPIPALDGGHIMFNLYEIIRKKAPSEAVITQLTIGGWVILLGLMTLGLYNDITRLMQ